MIMRVRPIAPIVLVLLLSSCKYGSLIEAGSACDVWQQETKGVFEVDSDGDGRQGKDSGIEDWRVDGDTYPLRECSQEESTRQFVGKEYITPWKVLVTEEEFRALKIAYKKFPY